MTTRERAVELLLEARVQALFQLLWGFELAVRLATAMPQLAPADSLAHAAAAVEASTPRIQPELLLAIAFVESRFDVTATSRVEHHHRRTGSYPSREPPRELDRRGTLYCGPLQTFAASWDECLAERDLAAAYAAGADELEHWLRDRRVRGDVTRALAGHGCGNHGVATGKCNAYPARVLWIARQLTLGLPPHVHAAPPTPARS